MIHTALLEEFHLIGHEFGRARHPAPHPELVDRYGHTVFLFEVINNREVPIQPLTVENVRAAVPVQIEFARVGVPGRRLLMGIVVRFVLVHHVDRALVVCRLQVGKPSQRTPSHRADQDWRIGIHLADGCCDTRVELVPVVERPGVLRVEFFRLVDAQRHVFAVWLAHQVIADHKRIIVVTFGGVAPHLGPGVLGGLIAPDRFDQQLRGEPVAGAVTIEGEVAAARPGAEGDDGEHVGLGDHVEQVIQISLHFFVQHVRWFFGEQARAGDVDIVGAQRRQAVEILLRIGRADIAAAEELWAVQVRHDDALPDVGSA